MAHSHGSHSHHTDAIREAPPAPITMSDSSNDVEDNASTDDSDGDRKQVKQQQQEEKTRPRDGKHEMNKNKDRGRRRKKGEELSMHGALDDGSVLSQSGPHGEQVWLDFTEIKGLPAMETPEGVSVRQFLSLPALSGLYDMLCNMIIRPPRVRYSRSALGPESFHVNGVAFHREDLTLRNPRGHVLRCSWWLPDLIPSVVADGVEAGKAGPEPKSLRDIEALPIKELKARLLSLDVDISGCVEKSDLCARLAHTLGLGDNSSSGEIKRAERKSSKKQQAAADTAGAEKSNRKKEATHGRSLPVDEEGTLPCILYSHGNSGCRLDAFDAVRTLLGQFPCSVFALDFSGSGMSDGTHVTLGHFERYDLSTAIEFLNRSNRVSRIALWGRSMGAATSLLCASQQPEKVVCVVLDSSFASLKNVAEDLVLNEQLQLPIRPPGFLVNAGLRLVRRSVQKRAFFDIFELEIVNRAPCCYVPALLGHGDGDTFIPPSHSERLKAAMGGDVNLITFAGDHNSARPQFFYDSVTIFLRNHLWPDREPPAFLVRRRETASSSSYGRTDSSFMHGTDDFLASALDAGGERSAHGYSEEELLAMAVAASLETSNAPDRETAPTVGDDSEDDELKRALQESLKDSAHHNLSVSQDNLDG